MSYKDIPIELQQLNSWVCWRLEDIGASKPTKIPYDPKTGKLASVTDETSWSQFTTVCAATGYSGIGLVFNDNDPYTFIDLDDTNGDTIAYDRQIKIYREFDSWSEVSPSGRGLHIIVKGKVPAGRRRSYIEVYSSQRYATFTGNVYNNQPIKDCQDKLMQLWVQMGDSAHTTIYTGNSEQTQSDKQIIDTALNAVNGEKFKNLLDGEWVNIYQSQSEADYAFINIVAFYTQNRNQIARIFRGSKLGQRDKAKRKDYVDRMIDFSFDRMLPLIDFDGFKNAIEFKLVEQQRLELPVTVAQLVEPSAHNTSVEGSSPSSDTSFDVGSTPSAVATSSIKIPPGLMGELAQFIYQAAPRPVPEIALAASIGLMAGITGRAYNISGTGLNQYVLLIAPTGVGKEAMASGIDKLMNTISLQVPTSSRFIGPSEIASGQALIKHLSKTSQSFVSILGEFGLRLEAMSSPTANSAEKALKRVLLDLFNKSGHGHQYRPSIFADADKNIQGTESPSFSILGESTPERFYGALNEDMISEGLLPRFMLIEYNGIRPPLSGSHLLAVPSMILIEKLASLVAYVEQVMHARKVFNVEQTEEAIALTKSFDKFADAQINNTSKEVVRQLWNRAHIKVLKLAALVAVGVNMIAPVVQADYVKWAIGLVQDDIRALSNKFEQGLIGANTLEVRQNLEVIRMMKDFVVKDWEYIKKYAQGKCVQQMHHEKVIPYSYLNKRLSAVAAFRLDRNGATVALKRAIQILLDSDKIREAAKPFLAKQFGTTQRAFVVTDVSLLD